MELVHVVEVVVDLGVVVFDGAKTFLQSSLVFGHLIDGSDVTFDFFGFFAIGFFNLSDFLPRLF